MTSAQVRARLVEALVLDLIGPIADPTRAGERLEQGPSRWYLTGFLVPSERASVDLPTDEEDEDEDDDDLFGPDDDPLDQPTAESVLVDDSDKNATVVTSRRNFLPSSMGLSVLVPNGTTELKVSVRWGDYHPEFAPEPPEPEPAEEAFALGSAKPGRKPKPVPAINAWVRQPRERTLTLSLRDVFSHGLRRQGVPGSDGLSLEWLARPAPSKALDKALVPDGALSVNVYLVNHRKAIHGALKDQAMAFQAELLLHCERGFVPRPSLSGLDSEDDDVREADLQYRDVCEFGVGHNTSADAEVNDDGTCQLVRTAWVPHALVERVEPRKLEGITLGMERLANLKTHEEALSALSGLADLHEAWIAEQPRTLEELHYERRVETAETLLHLAGIAARRIRQGIEALQDPRAFRAFTLANAAMARQARRRVALPQGQRPEDVPEPEWYPFQLAFLLLNLRGIVHPEDADRQTVDLLFFPTGGGKTEAYLGLAAFTLLFRRFREGVGGAIPRYAGVTVLMRYTLRLLTLDQLSRAAALICSMELMRRENPRELGSWPFEIGLWVGSGATPNHMGRPGDAHGMVSKVLAFKQGRETRPPVPLEKCPWCGSKLVADCFSLHPGQDRAEELRIACLNDGCDFTGDHPLPIHLVDEPIYNRLPGFLIATVDKFAAMPWKGEVAKLFGRVKSFGRGIGFLGDCDDRQGADLDPPYLPPPELIIQDELHLISGPLGTVTGLYETAIDHLCRDRLGIGPKIVSSTATVRRAQEQIRALFGRTSVQIFPPPGPNRRDSFFARTVTNRESARLYLGIAAQGRSAKRVLLKTYLALMSAAGKLYEDNGGKRVADNPADPYMTMLGYFNSLRELGGTRRLVEDELTSRLHQYGKRKRLGELDSPFADRPELSETLELTSRYSTSRVSEAKDALNRPFREPGSVDVALATNMISVGLDIPRLGLMAVFAQPKMTAEYIQATSRVGRQAAKPGLIVTIFNINRPRDRSHYERFRFFHDTFYRNVEATSVTPFSPRTLDRALFAVTVALARLGHDFMLRDGDAKLILRHSQHLDDVARTVAERARVLDLEGSREGLIEQTPVYGKVRGLLDEWFTYAEELHQDRVDLNYAVDGPSTTRKLLHEMLDPKLVNLSPVRRQFKAPRSMRDVEPAVAVLPRRFKDPTAPIKVKNEVTFSALRQSQLVTTYGPGAMIDLPWFSAVVAGLDFWDKGTRIPEPRLEAKAGQALGGVSVELASPQVSDKLPDPTTNRGVIAWKFPRWSITQETRRQAEPDGRTYQTRMLVPEPHLDPKTGQYEGADFDDNGRRRKLDVVPIRFIRACKNGHMGDIDWYNFVHRGHTNCGGKLWLEDLGSTGELNELRVRCDCGLPPRYISEAVGKENPALGRCDGSQDWLGPAARKEECDQMSRLLIRTAGNAYFPQKLNVISMPDRGREVHAAVGQLWDGYLHAVTSLELLRIVKTIGGVAASLEGFSDDQVIEAIEARRAGQDGPPQRKIKEVEFELLTCGQPRIGKNEHDSVFYAEEYPRSAWGDELNGQLERVVIVHRLREVTALVGYTRFDYISPDIDGEFDLNLRPARLGLNANWIPASENKGEGLFLQFPKDRVDAWKQRPAVRAQADRLERGHRNWCHERDVPGRPFFGVAYVMLHSLSHMLISAISLECGYPASSIKERIYANPNDGYGILLYTAGADSYGTLGGLAGAARSLDHFLRSALEFGRLCSNDPVCAQHQPDNANERRHLQGAACHGCLLISETSCEQRNDLLDRGLVVATVACQGAEFFPDPA
jgi:hypothetical protein